MPPEKSMGVVSVEIEHLQQGQVRIEAGLEKLSGKLDSVGDALTSLIRLTEKHDALADRVSVLETTAKERETVAHRGQAYMNATKYLLPLALTVIMSMVGWLVSRVDEHDEKLHDITVKHAEAHK